MSPPTDSTFEKVFKRIEEKKEAWIARLSEAVAIRSVSAEPELRPEVIRMVEWTKEKLQGLGAEVCVRDNGVQEVEDGEKIPYPPILLASLGSDPAKKTLLIYGHLDVQPDGWDTDPFTLTEKDEKLFGRGSTDDKGPVLGWLNVIETLQELKVDIPVNLKFVLEGMEESGSEGLDELLEKEKDGFLANVDLSCISDNYWLGTNRPCLTYGLRFGSFPHKNKAYSGVNYYTVEVSCAKQDLHSGVFGGSVHEAMNDLMWLLAQLTELDGTIKIPGVYEMVAPLTDGENAVYERLDFDCEGYRQGLGHERLARKTKREVLQMRWRNPTLSIHGVEGAFSGPGTKTVIPCKVSLDLCQSFAKVIGKFSIRTVPNMDSKKLDDLVVAYLERLWQERGSPNAFKPTAHHSGKWWLADHNDENFRAGARACKRVFGVEPDLTREGASIPVTITIQELTGKSVMLLPMGACDDMAHSQNEKLNVSNYVQGMKTLAAYLLELASFE